MNERFLLIVSGAAIVGGISAIIFLGVQSNNQPETFVEKPEPIQNVATAPVVVSQGGITVRYYGGPADIKTFIDKGIEYALLRNPENVGGLTFATRERDDNYYFVLDTEGNRIPYTKGDPKGMHGYTEIGLISEALVRERIPAIEYFISYPDATSARLANMQEIADTGIANRYLSSQVAVLTNKNTGKAVVAEIDHRSTQQGALLVSEAVGRELGLDNGSTGNIEVQLVPAESKTIGPVR
jgi:hypothetical protein